MKIIHFLLIFFLMTFFSEYGYDNSDELTDVLNSLREAHFPIDGFVLDLLWFGGIGASWTRLDDGVVVVRSEVLPVSTPLTIQINPTQETSIPADRPLFLAHYMTWYQTPDVSGYWGWHWTMNHFNPNQVDDNNRPQVASHFMPLTGLYDSQDPIVLEYQVLLMKLSGIDGVIVDWYGTANYNDYATLNTATIALFDMISRAGLKFAICYEDRTIRTMVNDNHLDTTTAVEQGTADMRFAHDRWFGSDTYVTHMGQPLVFVFGPLYFRQLSDWTAMFADMNPLPALITLDNNLSFAAIGSYPWPPMSFSGGLELHPAVLESYLDQFYRNARRSDLIVGSAFPGFHDIYAEANVRTSYGYLDARDGQTLRDTLTRAFEADARIVQLVTWNDYGEGTTIEPTEEYGYDYLEIIQAARQEKDATFDITPDDLRLPMRLYEARNQYKGNAEMNLRLDSVFDAIIAGELDTAGAILDSLAE